MRRKAYLLTRLSEPEDTALDGASRVMTDRRGSPVTRADITREALAMYCRANELDWPCLAGAPEVTSANEPPQMERVSTRTRQGLVMTLRPEAKHHYRTDGPRQVYVGSEVQSDAEDIMLRLGYGNRDFWLSRGALLLL